MTTKDTDGPAFPVMPPVDESGRTAVGYPYPEEGMTLRDYFAAKAMAGLMTLRHRDHTGPDGPTTLAADAYAVADAMLAERAK